MKPEDLADLANRHVDYGWTPVHERALHAAVLRGAGLRRLRNLAVTVTVAGGLVGAAASAVFTRHTARHEQRAAATEGLHGSRFARHPGVLAGSGARDLAVGAGAKRLLAHTAPFFDGVAGLERLCRAVDVVESGPFDGLVLSVHLDRFWRAPLADAELDALAPALRCLGRGRVRDNLVLLTVGAIDWSDEQQFSVLVRNARRLAAFLRQLPVQGIFLDTQTYVQRTGHFAVPDGQSLEALEPVVRRRGAELMEALQSGGRPLAVLFTLGYAEAFRRTCIERQPLARTQVALLPAFIDGVTDVAERSGGQRPYVADAFLSSYATEQPAAFPVLRDLIHADGSEAARRWLPGVTTYTFPAREDPWSGAYVWPERLTPGCNDADRGRLARELDAGFGLMLDYEHDIRGGFALHPPEFRRNHLTPEQLAEVASAALESSDRYVWLYSSTLSFWPGTDNAPVPREYVDALRTARGR